MDDPDAGLRAVAGELARPDGARLSYRRWRGESPSARAAIVHGLGDHAGRFAALGRWLASAGLEALALDLRGHGRSDGRRGHAPGFAVLLDDLAALLRRAEAEGGVLPTILVGHSLGGLLVLRHLQEAGPSDVLRGGVAVAPFLALEMEPPAWKLALGRLADRWWPRLSLRSGADTELVLRDREARAERRADPRVHDRISARLWGEMQRAAERVRSAPERLGAPVLLQVAGDDRVVSSAAIEALAARSGPGVEVRRYPEAYHDLLHDPVADRAARDLLEWIRERVGAPGSQGPKTAYRLHPSGRRPSPRRGAPRRHDLDDEPGARAMDEKEPVGEEEGSGEEDAPETEPEASRSSGSGAAELELDGLDLPEEVRAGLEELEDLRDRHLRLAAEYDNYRKRTRRELSESRERAQAELTGRLLDALDDLDRFVESTDRETDVDSLREGMELVRRKLWKELSAAGLERMEAEGERFDPEVHDALLTTPVDDPEEDGLVSRVLITGYRFGDSVLRPARVEVKRHVGEGVGDEAGGAGEVEAPDEPDGDSGREEGSAEDDAG